MSREKVALYRERLKGRKTEGGFVRIAHFVARSPEFLALSPRATKAFLLILSRYNGENNGDISIPRKDLALLGFGRNGDAFAAGVRELVAKGFVIVTRPGGYLSGCALYAVTTEPLDASPGKHACRSEHKPRHDWKKKTNCTESVHDKNEIRA
jgi:hypothetical protein